ncbi:MAG: hypothetical protein KME38_04255 [Spirirestis rafaelensis WJT71-NPBG6]|jgi:hypothetical protein|nr:hypothetical protein [Spirirestis rafaelensis WJT71-NPBG6]
MNVGFFKTIPLTPLLLLWLAYAVLGWYLAAHHIVWLMGAFVTLVVLFVVSRSVYCLEALITFGSQTLIIVLALSGSIVLVATWSLLITLFILPLAATILAHLEMRFAGLNELYTFVILTILAGLGLGMGEIIDLVFFPSIRY